MDPLTALAAAELKRRLWKVLARVLAVLAPVVVVGGIAMAVFWSSLLAGDSSGGQLDAAVDCNVVTRPGPVDVSALDADQVANAQTIVAVGRELGVPSEGWVIALSTALQESTLRNLPYGDRDSIGLFQQRDAWGSRADRLDPATATTMFFTGGRQGQRGLLAVPDYLTLPVTLAAQAVQVSAFPNAYAKWETLARDLAGSSGVSGAECQSGLGDATTSGVMEAALSQLGVPYSWGGGTLDAPGLGFGSGASTVGFDCSSFTRFVWFQGAGVTLPRVASDQAAAVTRVPLAEVREGDLLFFHDPQDPPSFFHHVGIYDGHGNIIHAPTTGRTVEVKPIDLTDGHRGDDTIVAGRPAAAV